MRGVTECIGGCVEMCHISVEVHDCLKSDQGAINKWQGILGNL